MDDVVLPMPEPDWSRPMPSTAVSQEGVQAVAALSKLAKGIPPWLEEAMQTGVEPADWSRMADQLQAVLTQCRALSADERPVIDAGDSGGW